MTLKKLLLALIVMTGMQVEAQINLVTNPGFEDTLGCPNQINQVSLANGWDTYRGTPDFYHVCATIPNPNFGVPVNARGYQQPHGGNAYSGIFTFARLLPNEREFIGRQLAQPLVIGQQYFVSFWVNHVDTSQTAFATDNLGAKFSTVGYGFGNPDTINNQPHVFTTTIITDTTNWVQVRGNFVADSSYVFIEIGNFFEDALTDTVRIVQHPLTNYAYYFIDDVCVSNDSTICFTGDLQNMEEHNKNFLEIFPVPAKNVLQVKSKQLLKSITLYEITGKQILFFNTPSFNNTIPVMSYATGIYILKTESEAGINISKIEIVRNE